MIMNSVLSVAGWGVNPNLLDNWYFGNPVNQRGQSAYSGLSSGQYTIDRWKVGGTDVTVADGAIDVSGGNNSTFIQDLESGVSGPLTLSVLISAIGTGTTRACVRYTDGSTYQGNPLAVGLNVVTLNSSKPVSRVFLFTNAANSYTLKAIKLEIGSQQTLAHLENGVWVLNAIPNYGEQLARCQRYFYTARPSGVFILGDCMANSTAYTTLKLPLPVSMRTTPSVTSDKMVYSASGYTNGTAPTSVAPLSTINRDFSQVNVLIGGTFTTGKVYSVIIGAGGHLSLSADL